MEGVSGFGDGGWVWLAACGFLGRICRLLALGGVEEYRRHCGLMVIGRKLLSGKTITTVFVYGFEVFR